VRDGLELKLKLALLSVCRTTFLPNIQVMGFMVQDDRPFGSDPRPKLIAKSLTPRQREVVELLARGKTVREVALVLNLTQRGVVYHKYSVMRKLNLRKSTHLIQFAIKSGILKT
jgi:DNA-binding NarL/FixJ family response regulator